MKIIVFISLLMGCYAVNANAGLFKKYEWEQWEVKGKFNAYGSEWTMEERIQSVNYSPWHISRWFIWQNYSARSGDEKHLINRSLNFDQNIVSLVFFPQKNGSYKSLLNRPFIGGSGRVNYFGAFGVYEENGVLKVWLNPSPESNSLLPPYTDCGFLTGKEKIAYVTDRRHEPETYYGEFNPKTQKFYIKYSSAPIQSIYRAEWGAPPSIGWQTDRDWYKRMYGEKELEKHKNEAFYFNKVEEEARIPLVCNVENFVQARQAYTEYINTIWKPEFDKLFSMLSDHEKATFRREDCDGIGLNYRFGCKQINRYGLGKTESAVVLPKGVKPPRIEDAP